MTELHLPPDSAVHQALAVLRDERDAARREALYYRITLEAIKDRAKREYDAHPHGADILIVLSLVHNCAHRALLWEGKERRRTWRDRLAAWWTTKRTLWRER